jgi:hypothetical protein
VAVAADALSEPLGRAAAPVAVAVAAEAPVPALPDAWDPA